MLLLGRYRRPCDGAAHGSAVYIMEFVTADGFLKDRRPDLISGTSEVFGRGRYLRFRAEVFSTESLDRQRKREGSVNAQTGAAVAAMESTESNRSGSEVECAFYL